jgi:hypothetical protein
MSGNWTHRMLADAVEALLTAAEAFDDRLRALEAAKPSPLEYPPLEPERLEKP